MLYSFQLKAFLKSINPVHRLVFLDLQSLMYNKHHLTSNPFLYLYDLIKIAKIQSCEDLITRNLLECNES